MRITALTSMLALTVLATAAHAGGAEHEYRYQARTRAVADPEASHAYTAAQAAAVAKAPTPALGELAITGRVHHAGLSPEGRADLTGGEVVAPREPWLSTSDIHTAIAPHAEEIERCFAQVATGGKLDLTLVIGRAGHLRSLKAAAGLSAPATRKLEACVRSSIGELALPARRNDTTAVVPYLFVKTAAPGAGPILSCWSAKGC